MLSTGNILIVDDDVNLRRTLALILRRRGYSVTAAEHPAEAMQRLTSSLFDLVFVDLKMPEGDGIALVAQVRAGWPELPLLILTGHATLEAAIEALRHGARDFLLKPVEPQRILARVQEVLEERRQPARQRELVVQIQLLATELQHLGGENGVPAGSLPPPPVASAARYLQRGRLALDLRGRQVLLEDRIIPLSPGNFDYLTTLARHAPDPVSHEALVGESQGYDVSRLAAREMVRWRMHELRQALEPDPLRPVYIITVRGFGYRMSL